MPSPSIALVPVLVPTVTLTHPSCFEWRQDGNSMTCTRLHVSCCPCRRHLQFHPFPCPPCYHPHPPLHERTSMHAHACSLTCPSSPTSPHCLAHHPHCHTSACVCSCDPGVYPIMGTDPSTQVQDLWTLGPPGWQVRSTVWIGSRSAQRYPGVYPCCSLMRVGWWM